jgi:nucleoside-diphosphate-sugar epimerase
MYSETTDICNFHEPDLPAWSNSIQGQGSKTMNSRTSDHRTALVIGATGGVGGEVAHALMAHGWRVLGLNRTPDEARRRASRVGPVEWIAGDAMSEADLVAAAAGVDVIFHGANPPGYKDWRGLALPMLKNTIAAARACGARIILPGNVYNFGPDAGALVDENSPQHPLTRKGRVRVEMEQLLREAGLDGVRSLVVRAGDFFGAHQPASWFKDAMVKPGKPLRSVVYPGDFQVGHAWAYLPDLAETIARLADIEATLQSFACFHFGGHWFEHGVQIAEAIRSVAGNENLPIRKFPWIVIYLGAPFVTFMREAIEMRYLWRIPLRLDNSRLVSVIGAEPHTELQTALRRTLEVLQCLPRPASRANAVALI